MNSTLLKNLRWTRWPGRPHLQSLRREKAPLAPLHFPEAWFAKPEVAWNYEKMLIFVLHFHILGFEFGGEFILQYLQEIVWRLQLQPPWSWPLRFCRQGKICWYLYLPIIIPTAFVALDFFTAPTMILFQLCRRTRHYDPEHCTCKACKKKRHKCGFPSVSWLSECWNN